MNSCLTTHVLRLYSQIENYLQMKANLTSICLSLNTVTLNCTDNNYDIYLVNNMVRNNTNKNTLILKENSDNG